MIGNDKKFILIEGEASIQGSEAWKEFRRDKIGGSDIATIIGLNPWETPLEYWKRKINSIDIEENDAMKRGKALERPARDLLNKQTGKNYQPCVVQSIANPSLIASLDGMYVDDEGKIFVCEIKCPNRAAQELAKKGEIPSYYVPQVCHQCMVCGITECLYVSWDGKSDQVITVPYKTCETMCSLIKNETERFLYNMANFLPPYAYK